MSPMKSIRLCLMILAMFLLLSACAAPVETESVTVPTTAPPTEPPKADIGGTEIDCTVTELNLGEVEYDLDMLIQAFGQLKDLKRIDLGETSLRAGDLERLSAAYPDAEIEYAVKWQGLRLTKRAESLDLSAMKPEQTEELLGILPMMPKLREINLVDENGVCAFTLENLDELDMIRELCPDVYLRVSFDLFGQTVTSEDERIEYYCVEIGNEGAEVVRRVLPYLRSCTYFLMDGCGIDYEILAQMREDFPQTKIVWRVWLMEENYKTRKFLRCGSFLTDTHRIRTTYVNDRNSHVLNYCTETKYVDVGHVWALTQCDFLSYMPDLEVCIIAITEITDISPLANHEKLEYLELFTTDIADISPLLTCPNIEHLNLSNMPYLDDITPVFTLTKLKRLRMVDSPLISEEEMQQAAEALPDCEMLNAGHFATAGYWRWKDVNKEYKVERYELLCEQMEYKKDYVEYGIP